MAGRSVECSECRAKNRVSRTAQRTAGQPSNLPRVVLLGSCIFLAGVLGMLAVKLTPIFLGEDDTAGDPAVASDPAGQVAPNPAAVDIADAAITITPVDSTTQVPDGSTPPEREAADVGSVSDAAVPSEINTDRGRELMAAMSDVGVKVTEFRADVRGTVTDAVRSGVSGAIEMCQVIVRAPNAEPILYIELQLRGEQLVMSARLIALDEQRPVRVWERSGVVTTLDEKATVTGIIPTNLHRDVETFFKSLRLEFNDARRQFSQ